MFDKLIEILLYVPRVIYSAFVDSLVFLFELIPVPEFVSNIDLSGFSELGYFMSILQMDVGIGLILTALIARFIVRRLPFIG